MKMHFLWLTVSMALFLAAVILPTGVIADVVVYNNGPANASLNGINNSTGIYSTAATSNSFTLGQSQTLTVAKFAYWFTDSPSWSPPTTVNWAIGTDKYLSDVSGGIHTSTLTNSNMGDFPFNYYQYSSTFSLSAAPSLAAGTYWLTLTNAGNVSNTDWAASSSPPEGSQAYYNGWSFSVDPDSFQLYSVPEPSTLVLSLAAGLGIAIAWVARARGTGD